MNLDWNSLARPLAIHGVRILVILLAALAIYRVVALLVVRLQKRVEDDDPSTQSEAEKRAETLGRIAKQVTLIAVFLVAGMMILREVGFEIGPIIAGAGIAGLAVGFGAQNLVRDVITGFFLLLENQIRVGDVVEVAGKSGLVEELNLRTTVLRDLEGIVHVVPNGAITTVSNRTRGWARTVLDVGVAYRENVDRVIEVLREVGAEMYEDPAWRPRLVDPLEIPGVERLADSSVNIRIMFKTIPLQQWNVGRELRRRIKNRFDEVGIEIPFPHTTLYVGEGRQGILRAARPGAPGPEIAP